MNIIITGASRGIGFETAKLLAKEHKVYCLSRNIEPLTALKNDNIIPISFDLITFDSSKLAEVFDAVDTIDIIINNAGFIVNKPFTEISPLELQNMYAVNVLSPFRLVQYFYKKLSQNNSHVLNISSMGGVQGSSKFPGLSGYSSSKGALTILTECLAEEFKDDKITVNCLALGAVQTEMLEEAFPGYKAPFSPEKMAKYVADFAVNGKDYYNGKVMNVAVSTP
jgi:3-oxoacyl-[acyl-carrier protein] reductase